MQASLKFCHLLSTPDIHSSTIFSIVSSQCYIHSYWSCGLLFCRGCENSQCFGRGMRLSQGLCHQFSCFCWCLFLVGATSIVPVVEILCKKAAGFGARKIRQSQYSYHQFSRFFLLVQSISIFGLLYYRSFMSPYQKKTIIFL